MATNHPLTGKAECVLKRLTPAAVNPVRVVSGSRPPKQLTKDQLGGYFAGMTRAAYLVLMVWNSTETPAERTELENTLIIKHLAETDWFSEAEFIQNEGFRKQVNEMVQISLYHLTHAKRLTNRTQYERLGVSESVFYRIWRQRQHELESFLSRLLSQAAQQIERNL